MAIDKQAERAEKAMAAVTHKGNTKEEEQHGNGNNEISGIILDSQPNSPMIFGVKEASKERVEPNSVGVDIVDSNSNFRANYMPPYSK